LKKRELDDSRKKFEEDERKRRLMLKNGIGEDAIDRAARANRMSESLEPETPSNKDSKITFDTLMVDRAITKIYIEMRSEAHALRKSVMKSSRKPPYRMIEYGESKSLDMDYARIILIKKKHPFESSFDVVFFDDTP